MKLTEKQPQVKFLLPTHSRHRAKANVEAETETEATIAKSRIRNANLKLIEGSLNSCAVKNKHILYKSHSFNVFKYYLKTLKCPLNENLNLSI